MHTSTNDVRSISASLLKNVDATYILVQDSRKSSSEKMISTISKGSSAIQAAFTEHNNVSQEYVNKTAQSTSKMSFDDKLKYYLRDQEKALRNIFSIDAIVAMYGANDAELEKEVRAIIFNNLCQR